MKIIDGKPEYKGAMVANNTLLILLLLLLL